MWLIATAQDSHVAESEERKNRNVWGGQCWHYLSESTLLLCSVLDSDHAARESFQGFHLSMIRACRVLLTWRLSIFAFAICLDVLFVHP